MLAVKDDQGDPASSPDPEQARWEARLNSRHFRGHPDYGKGRLSPRAERLFASAILAVFVVLTVIAIWYKF